MFSLLGKAGELCFMSNPEKGEQVPVHVVDYRITVCERDPLAVTGE